MGRGCWRITRSSETPFQGWRSSKAAIPLCAATASIRTSRLCGYMMEVAAQSMTKTCAAMLLAHGVPPLAAIQISNAPATRSDVSPITAAKVVKTLFMLYPPRSRDLPAWEFKFDPRVYTPWRAVHHAIDLVFCARSLLVFGIQCEWRPCHPAG